MKDWIKRNFGVITSAYLGGMLTITGVNIDDWRWWIIVIPTIIGFFAYTSWRNE